MIIKCGESEYTLTAKDKVMFNGQQYKIVSQGGACGPHVMVPIIWKSIAKRLIKKGAMVEDKNEGNIIYYKINE